MTVDQLEARVVALEERLARTRAPALLNRFERLEPSVRAALIELVRTLSSEPDCEDCCR